MRNSPLWRPQATARTDIETPPDAPGGLQKASIFALGGLGLAILAGAAAISFFGFQDDTLTQPTLAEAAPSVPAETPAPSESQPNLTKSETPVPATHGRLAATASTADPAAGPTIDVAIAQNEFDVARLEEMTGMVPPAPVAGPDERSVAVAPSASEALQEPLAELRPGVETPVDPLNATATDPNSPQDDMSETASIQPNQPVVAPESPPESAVEAPARNLPALSAMRVNRYVNMRSGPADESSVVMVVPAGATVQAQSGCGWCAVTYQGKQGYIYRSFLGAGQSASSARPTAPSTKPGLY